jgi:hypothetical protein
VRVHAWLLQIRPPSAQPWRLSVIAFTSVIAKGQKPCEAPSSHRRAALGVTPAQTGSLLHKEGSARPRTLLIPPRRHRHASEAHRQHARAALSNCRARAVIFKPLNRWREPAAGSTKIRWATEASNRTAQSLTAAQGREGTCAGYNHRTCFSSCSAEGEHATVTGSGKRATVPAISGMAEPPERYAVTSPRFRQLFSKAFDKTRRRLRVLGDVRSSSTTTRRFEASPLFDAPQAS